MLLREEDSNVFKQWLLPKLETISDADAEVLADYVIALVTANDSEANIRRDCVESLGDFLQDNTEPFVQDVIQSLRKKSYASSAAARKVPSTSTAPIPSILNASAPEYDPNNPRLTYDPPQGAPRGPAGSRTNTLQTQMPGQDGQAQPSRKRKAPGRDVSDGFSSQDSHYDRNGAGRQTKQTARRGGKFNAANNARGPHSVMPAPGTLMNLANLPPPPPGLPPFDLSDPVAMMAMMAVMSGNMPNMPTLPGAGQGQQPREKCSDYHGKGFCSLGNMCQFEHEDRNKLTQSREGKKNKGQQKGGRRRASISLTGPSYDSSNTALVIEQIPKNHLNDADLRDFFTQYGSVIDIELQPHRRLAILRFDDHASADKAYRSPKAVFDNRFVKVFWHKPEDFSVDDDALRNRDDEEPLDLAEIAKQQAEAQKLFEERQKKQEAADARASEIDKLMREKDDEMAEIRRQLAALAAGRAVEGLEDEQSQTLATLQAEAESLLANHDFLTADGDSQPRPSGSHRGYPSRGGGYNSSRAFTGRGGFPGQPHTRYSRFKKLDNRPKSLAVKSIPRGSKKDEALRQFLFNVDDCISIDLDSERPDTVILTFSERRHAEEFLDSSLRIPDMDGPLDLSWVPNTASFSANTNNNAAAHDDGDSSDTVEEPTIKQEEQQDVKIEPDVDMDVDDDVDRWL